MGARRALMSELQAWLSPLGYLDWAAEPKLGVGDCPRHDVCCLHSLLAYTAGLTSLLETCGEVFGSKLLMGCITVER